MKAVEAVKVKFYCIYNTVGEPDYHISGPPDTNDDFRAFPNAPVARHLCPHFVLRAILMSFSMASSRNENCLKKHVWSTSRETMNFGEFFCCHLFLRHGGSQFTQFCLYCNVFFLSQPTIVFQFPTFISIGNPTDIHGSWGT